jgi:hypothetical protein
MYQAPSKGSASFSIVENRITGDVTLADKGRTREFTRQIIDLETQGSC